MLCLKWCSQVTERNLCQAVPVCSLTAGGVLSAKE